MIGLRFLPFFVATLVCGALASPALAATTYYASAAGSGTTCSQASPCSIEKAALVAQDGDSVLVAPGSYELKENVSVEHDVQFGGESSAAATVLKTKSSATLLSNGAADVIHDMSVVGGGSLVMNTGTGERLFVSYSGTGPQACGVVANTASITVLRDSVCWYHGSNATGQAALVGDFSPTATARFYNDTLISAAANGTGLFVQPTGSSKATVEATNTILQGALDDALVSGTAGSSVILASSNFNTSAATSPNTVTAPGAGTNQTAAPAFVNAAAGDFREAAGSPTIEKGASDPAIGSFDLARNPRLGGPCPGKADIGAYQYALPEACPVPAPAPVPPVPSNAIKLGKLIKNKKRGTATLQVTVPGAGQLTLSGKGVKKVTRNLEKAGLLKLPVTPVGAAKKKLATLGSTKLGLTLKFVPTGGSAGKRTKSVKLTELLR